MLCILTSFRVLRAPKSWLKHFFQPFSTFFVHFKLFSVISRLKSIKNVWKWTKNMFFFHFCLLFKAGWHAKTGWLPEEVPQNCLFSVDFLLNTAEKKCFYQLSGARSTQKVVKIHNMYKVHLPVGVQSSIRLAYIYLVDNCNWTNTQYYYVKIQKKIYLLNLLFNLTFFKKAMFCK